jgi:hypothetical protein
MGLSSFISRAIPTAVGYATGGPVGAATAFANVTAAKQQEEQIKQQIAKEEQEYRKAMEIFNSQTNLSSLQQPLSGQQMALTQPIQAGGFLDTIRGGIREVGGLVSDVFSSGLPQLFGVKRPPSVIQQPAVTTTSSVGAKESQGSGSIQAGFGAALPSIIAQGRNLLKSPVGQLVVGTGTGFALGGSTQPKTGMRITRKMKSQARMVLNMTGGNISAAADMLGVDQNTLIMILLKRFRNDGPVVTKAALRKTRQTVRRLKSMCDMYDSLRPRAAARRSPMKRASTTTLIKN